MDTQLSPRAAFTYAVRNDNRGGLISRDDAQSIVDAGLASIRRSNKPEDAFAAANRFVNASFPLLGGDARAASTLSGFRARGRSAVDARLNALRPTALPVQVERAMQELIDDGHIEATGTLKITNGAKHGEGFKFDWSCGDKSGTAYALKHDGDWLLAPVELKKADVDKATAEMKRYFDEYWAGDLDGTPEEIADMREGFFPTGFIWPDNPDPVGISDSFPVALRFSNPIGSDHGFYAGVDPATGAADAGDFN